MSYFDDASLVMIPSGYKDQKVYSVKPIDGSGDLTFSRASNATRVNSSGLVEKVRTNEVIQSENFSTWTLRPSSSVTSNTIANPLDGAITADTINQGTNIYSGVYNSVSASSNYWTNSVYLKAGTLNYAYVLINGSPSSYAWFNLSTGSVSGVTSNELASITDAGGGWYRCAIYSKVLASNGVLQFGFSDAAVFTPSVSGYGYAFGAQAEVSDFGPTPYIATTSSAVSVGPVSGLPRLDYSGGASCPSLLLEPQRTNAVTFSESFDNAAWTKVAGTITANNAVSPDGYQNADLFTADGTTTQHAVLQSQTAGAKTISFFVKMGTQRYVQILTSGTVDAVANYDLQTGSVGGLGSASTASMVDYGNGWWRLILTSTDVLTGGIYLCFANSLTDGRYPAVSSSGTVWIWGAMSELGATYASSYLNTLSTAVTRVADAASKTGISSLIGQTEGTIFVEFQTLQLNPTNVSRIILSDGTTSNYIFLGLNEAGSGNLSRLYVNNTGAGTSVSVFSSTALTVGTNKLAMAYKSGSFALYLNGNLVGSSSSAVTIPATSQLVIGGQSPSAINQLETMVDKQIILFKTRLSNADLATLTA